MKRTGWGCWGGLCLLLGSSCQGIEGDPAAAETDVPGPLATDSAGKETVWLIMKEQADLAPARAMRDWRARGQLVFDRLHRTATLSQTPLRTRLRSRGIEAETFWIVNAVRISAEPWLIRLMASLPEVAAVRPDRAISLPPRLEGIEEPRGRATEWGVDSIGAPAVWNNFGFRGDGIVVGSIDTGVDFDHPALRRQYRGRLADGTLDHNYSWFDPARVCGKPSLAPCDNAGHGTHTVGIIVGEDERDTTTNRVGVAPRARWIAAKGCESGDCSLSSLIRAGEWMLAPTDLNGANPRPDLRPHIVNNSWSAGVGDDVFFESIVKAWVAAGIFPLFASGNDGPACSSADSPADYSDSYAVGAYDNQNRIGSFSSRGNSTLGGAKPNISAPGVNIRSSIPGGGYGVSNGTSMATPHVAGAVALLWSAAPALVGDVAGTRRLLDQTAIDTEDLSCGGTAENNNVFGEGRLDVFAAVNLAPRAPTGVLEGIVRAAPADHPAVLANAQVRAQGGGADRTTTLESDGRFGMVLPRGRYTVTVSAFGYVSQIVSDVLINGEEHTARDFTLEVAPSHVVRGQVRQRDGRPVAGARVIIEGTPLLLAITDSRGAYHILGVPAGRYQVSATRGGCFDRATSKLSVDGADAELDLSLPRRSDYYGYFCEPQRAGFIEANNVLPFDEGRDVAAVALPFSFSFYGRLYRQAEIASAGYLTFVPAPGASSGAGQPGAARIPDGEAPNAAIYAFWDDLLVDERASVRTEVVGSSPHRAFVVEWRDVAFRDNPRLRVRFELILHEDGRILTQYFTAGPDSRQQGASATVGLEDPDGSDGFEYSTAAPSLESGSAVLYALPPAGVVEGQIIDANDGRPLGGVNLLAWSENAGARTTFTDDEGRYRLEVRVGRHGMSASALNYGEETRVVEIARGQAIHLDLALGSGRAVLAPPALQLPDENDSSAVFTLSNTGSRALNYVVRTGPAGGDLSSDAVGWLRVSPVSGMLAPGDGQSFQVEVDRALLPPGDHRAALLVWTDTPEGTLAQVPITLDGAPRPPMHPGHSLRASLSDLRGPNPLQQKRSGSPTQGPRPEATRSSGDGL